MHLLWVVLGLGSSKSQFAPMQQAVIAVFAHVMVPELAVLGAMARVRQDGGENERQGFWNAKWSDFGIGMAFDLPGGYIWLILAQPAKQEFETPTHTPARVALTDVHHEEWSPCPRIDSLLSCHQWGFLTDRHYVRML